VNSSPPVILFDGVCNLCNRIVQFVIKKDKKNQFLFASLQGKTGQEVLKKFHLDEDDFNSFILLENGKIYTRSTGALRMLKRLGRGWQLLYVFIIVPQFIRNAVYNWIAKKRYKWYGKRDECMIPTARLRERFLD